MLSTRFTNCFTVPLLGLLTALPLFVHAADILDVATEIPGHAIRMTPDGKTVVGLGFIWHADTGAQYIAGQAVDVADDGTVVVGTTTGASGYDEAAIWVNGELVHTLGGLPAHHPVGHLSSGYSVSADGSVVVGLGWTSDYRGRGFRWTQSEGMVELSHIGRPDEPDLDKYTGSRATVISSNGKLIGGFDEAFSRRAKLWFSDGTESLILEDKLINPLGLGEVVGISTNGKWVVGGGSNIINNPYYLLTLEPFIWHKGQGVTYLGLPDGADPQFAYLAAAVSDNGKVVVGGGGAHAYDGQVAWIWQQHRGMTTVKQLLEEACIAWSMDLIQSLVDVSADGRFVLGFGGYPIALKSYLIDLQAVKKAAQQCSIDHHY
jgi:uncharacterized membrane protein